MTDVVARFRAVVGPPTPGGDRPVGPTRFAQEDLFEAGLPAAASFIAVWLPFHLTGLNAPFGFLVCWFVLFIASYGVVTYRQHGVLEMKDKLATVVISAGAVVALLPVFLIVFFVLVKGVPTVFGAFPHFITHDLKGVGPNDPVSKAGMKHAILGTLEEVLTATVITVPIGVLCAAYLNEVGGRFAAVVRTVADAMTGLPSVIAGLFVYAAWVKPRGVSGFSGLAGALALCVVMLPTIVRTAEEVLRIVADHLREAALALGAPEWRMVLMVVLPTARAGLVTASILGVARAVGETAPVLLTTFGAKTTNLDLFHHPQGNLPVQVYEFVRSASGNNVKEAWGGALLLVLIVLTLFVLARILGTGGGSGKARVWLRRTAAAD